MTIYVLCGPPASGKTTLSEQLAQEYNAKLYHYDDLYITRSDLSKMVKQDLFTHNVVLDDLFIRKSWREELLDTLRGVRCTKVLIALTTPLDVCIERNTIRGTRLCKQAVCDAYKGYELPTLDEGWDEIIYY